ncbi:MAG: hypothetical protein U0T36_03490 [Saprospiraceae bacterium]
MKSFIYTVGFLFVVLNFTSCTNDHTVTISETDNELESKLNAFRKGKFYPS